MEATGNTYLIPPPSLRPNNTSPLFQNTTAQHMRLLKLYCLKKVGVGEALAMWGTCMQNTFFLNEKIPADGFHEGKTLSKMPWPVQIATANKKCETETQLVTTSWQRAIADDNCLQMLMYRKLRTWLSWLADRAGGWQLWSTWKLQKRSAFGTGGAGQPLPWQL